MENDSYRGEISFIQLAVIFLKRRNFFLFIFLILLIISGSLVFLKERTYEYLTQYNIPVIGEFDKNVFDTTKIQSRLQLNVWSDLKLQLKEDFPEGVPFNIEFNSDTQAGIINMTTKAEADLSDEVKRVHRELIENLNTSLDARLKRYRENLESQVLEVEESVRVLRELDQPGVALSRAQERIYELRDQLALVSRGEAVAVAQQSETPISVGRGMLAVALTVLSFMVALLCTYLAEFFYLVKCSLRDGESN